MPAAERKGKEEATIADAKAETAVFYFLYYIPYVTLSVMTFPAILDATGSQISGFAGLVAAVVLAWFGASLFSVAVAACVLVFVMELFIC